MRLNVIWGGGHNTPHLIDVLNLPHNMCVYCDANVKSRNVDELIPITAGGSMQDVNRVPCCGSCNSSKGNRVGIDLEYWLVTRSIVGVNVISHERAIGIARYLDVYGSTIQLSGDAYVKFQAARKIIREHFRTFEEETNASIDGLL